MLLIRTSAGESRLISPEFVVQIQPKPNAAAGSVIFLVDDTVIETDTLFGEFARDLFTKKFVGRV